jgi:hypothetical protein
MHARGGQARIERVTARRSAVTRLTCACTDPRDAWPQLHLPNYSSPRVLLEKLVLALEHVCDGFQNE